jgi:Domain of unknown function (DUF4407)
MNIHSLRRTGDFMAWLGGGDSAVLAEVPQDRGRFSQMAGVLLTTAGIAVFSMTFALHDGINAPLAPAVVLGLLWGVVILNLDRFLVLSMGSTRNKTRLILIALPRFALAAVLAAVISTPLTLRIFASDIQYQLAVTHEAQSKALGTAEKSSGPQQEADNLARRIAADKAILAGQLPERVTDPALQTAQSQVNDLTPKVAAAKKTSDRARRAWQCELYGQGGGCAGASTLAGDGPLAQAKFAEYQTALSSYNGLLAQLTAAQAAVTAAQNGIKVAQNTTLGREQKQASAELPGLLAQQKTVNRKIASMESSDQSATAGNNGFLAQLAALSTASSHDAGLALARLTVLALFFIIEVLPVSVKFLLNLTDETAYEVAARLKNDASNDRQQIKRAESRTLEEHASQERIAAADAQRIVDADMRGREVELGKHANEYVASHMQDILDAALLEWSTKVRTTLNGANGAGRHGSGPGSPPPPQARIKDGHGLPDEGKL